jgi:ribonuclease J
MQKKINFKNHKKEFLFLPLGGSGEIGMNLNLYHYNGKWLMVDLGIGFADLDLPGIDIIIPNINFIIKEIKKDIVGLIITHAHEDHVGAVPYLWPEIECPIFTTKFTAAIVRAKCREYGFLNRMKLVETEPNDPFQVGEFKINMVSITHSIPEMNGLVIETEKGKVFHTGDWKFDEDPVIGEPTNEQRLKEIGDSGILAMVGDSTNIFQSEHSGSEGDVGRSLEKLINKYSGKLIVLTTFASNVARLHSMCEAAKKSGRKIILQGRSLWRMYTAAKESGYLKDAEIYDEKQIKNFKRHELLVICTGCQGELLAVTNKIANKTHPHISLVENDVVIFSSKIIPGNEKKIYALFNKLAEMNINVLSEKNEFVHVSGHPSRPEVEKMYQHIRPKIAIPVHGEAIHLREHCKVASNIGVPHTVSIRNGDVVSLDENGPKKIGKVEAGYYAIDGNLILDSENEIIKSRKILRDNGAVLITLIVNAKKKIAQDVHITAPGVFEDSEDKDILDAIKVNVVNTLSSLHTLDKSRIKSSIESSVKKHIYKLIGKNPLICTSVIVI